MQKQAALNQLETIIGKLSNLNYHIEGNQLQSAIREIASVRDRLQGNQLTVMKSRPSTISYSIKSGATDGWLIVQLLENGKIIRGRHLKCTTRDAIEIIKGWWQYMLRTPAKKINILSSYRRSQKQSNEDANK